MPFSVLLELYLTDKKRRNASYDGGVVCYSCMAVIRVLLEIKQSKLGQCRFFNLPLYFNAYRKTLISQYITYLCETLSVLTTNDEISIVIVTYNSSVYVRSCLDSVIDCCKNLKLEIIIIDNNSSDSTLKILDSIEVNPKKFKITVIKQDHNTGFPAACNLGINLAHNDIVILMNPDVILEKNSLPELVNLIKSNNIIAIAQPKVLSANGKFIESVGGAMDFLGYGFPIGFGQQDTGEYRHVTEIFWATFACVVLRKKIIQHLGGLDSKFFLYNEDLDLCWRVWLANYQIVYVPTSVVYHIGQHSSGKVPYIKVFNQRKNVLITTFADYSLSFSLIATFLNVTLYAGGVLLSLVRRNKIDFWSFINALKWFLENMHFVALKRARTQVLKSENKDFLFFKKGFIKFKLCGVNMYIKALLRS